MQRCSGGSRGSSFGISPIHWYLDVTVGREALAANRLAGGLGLLRLLGLLAGAPLGRSPGLLFVVLGIGGLLVNRLLLLGEVERGRAAGQHEVEVFQVRAGGKRHGRDADRQDRVVSAVLVRLLAQ